MHPHLEQKHLKLCLTRETSNIRFSYFEERNQNLAGDCEIRGPDSGPVERGVFPPHFLVSGPAAPFLPSPIITSSLGRTR
jgi:hypothetical protein